MELFSVFFKPLPMLTLKIMPFNGDYAQSLDVTKKCELKNIFIIKCY